MIQMIRFGIISDEVINFVGRHASSVARRFAGYSRPPLSATYCDKVAAAP